MTSLEEAKVQVLKSCAKHDIAQEDQEARKGQQAMGASERVWEIWSSRN